MTNPVPRRRPASSDARIVAIAVVAIAAVLLAVDRLANQGTASASRSPSGPATPIESRPSSGPVSPASAVPEPTLVPDAAAPCTVEDLALAAGGWEGATGSMAGWATVINVSIDPCEVGGAPALTLSARDGAMIATGAAASPGPPVVLQPGDVAEALAVWRNWCDDPPLRPLWLRVSLFDDAARLEAPIRAWRASGVLGGPDASGLPRCDAPDAPSTIDALGPFEPPEPPEGGADTPPCIAAGLSAFLGRWGVAAGTQYANVVVFNGGGVACLMELSPVLELRDGDGRLLASAERWIDATTTFNLPSGFATLTTIGFADWCRANPKLPLQMDLRIADGRLRIQPTSDGSNIGIPSCNSSPGTPPTLFYDGPFSLPIIGGD